MNAASHTMKAVFREHGEDKRKHKYVIDDQLKLPDLNPTDVRIQVRACGLTPYKNCDDVLREHSDLQQPVGQEVAGIVSEVGSDVTEPQVGDHIAAYLPLSSECSGCATECIATVYDIVKLPKDVSFEDAAATIGDGVRAYTALFYHGRLCAGDTVLIVDGASNAGALMIQLATLWGAKVLATSSTKEERFYLEDMQEKVAHILDLQHINSTLVNSVMEETGGLGVDIIIDAGVRLFPMEEDQELLGENTAYARPTKHELISCLGAGGRWMTSHPNLQLDPPDSQQLFLKGASLCFLFEHIWGLSGAQYGRLQHIFGDIMSKLSSGDIKPHIVQKLHLHDAVNLLPMLDSVRVGKAILTFQ